MENQSPFTAEPFATKRSDGKVEVCLTTYKSWLPMSYLLPKEYVQQRSVLNELRLKSFMETLSERDREILKLKMQGMTDQKIAEKVGFKNHSAVVKRRKQIAEHFQKYVENE